MIYPSSIRPSERIREIENDLMLDRIKTNGKISNRFIAEEAIRRFLDEQWEAQRENE